ncbi:NAD-dependent epimerase/dehydratase family protein [Nocardioides sp. MH1]|uniref:NAD-dependent epimerase/dehydratase family protein n=1 Tax=Nocardioides sp. MH1 TaxID=3242490 RepID=UPI003522F57F
MRISVTGATGNVGSALLRRLTGSGQHQVTGLARRLPDAGYTDPDVTWVAVDLTRESCAPALRAAFAGADAVIHLAWGFQPSHDQDYLERLALDGTRRVIEAATAEQVPHLVHMSSIGAYSAKVDDEPVAEDWPTEGIASSWYGRTKAAAERMLDAHEASGRSPVVTRMRPGIVGQRSAGSALLRYGVPGLVPAAALDWLPVLPMDRRLRVPMVHSDDVAAAVEQVLLRRATGAFNLAAEPPLTTDRIAKALGARPLHVPSAVLRPLMSAAWHARLQQVDPGWLDLAFGLPLLDTSRARRELGWVPTVDAQTVFEETLAGMRGAASDRTSVLRPRSVAAQLRAAVRQGPVSSRQQP